MSCSAGCAGWQAFTRCPYRVGQPVFTWMLRRRPGGGPGAGASALEQPIRGDQCGALRLVGCRCRASTTVSGGLRVERRVADYADSADVQTPFPKETNHMIGGNLSWTRSTGEGEHVYATLARGYKGGGFNIGSGILPNSANRSRVAVEYRDRSEVHGHGQVRCNCKRTCSTCGGKTCRSICRSSCNRATP